MHCFICMTYLFLVCSVHPGDNRQILTQESVHNERRSIFRDVIVSLLIRSQLPANFDQYDENNLEQYSEFDEYGNTAKTSMKSNDAPKINDVEASKYRLPKSISVNDSNTVPIDDPKEEIVVYITTSEPKTTTQRPQKPKRTRPPNKKPLIKDEETESQKPEDHFPWTNLMAGQSQIGNRESQMVVKPTVIVNIRGSVNHRDSDIKIEGRTNNDTVPDVTQNIFNIKQEIRLESLIGKKEEDKHNKEDLVKQDVKVILDSEKGNNEKNSTGCKNFT